MNTGEVPTSCTEPGHWGSAVPTSSSSSPAGDATTPHRTLDAPGTCHLVGCPNKGEHPPHPWIGAPSEETWRATSQPTLSDQGWMTCLPNREVRRLHSFVQAIGRDPGTATCYRREAAILADLLRALP